MDNSFLLLSTLNNHPLFANSKFADSREIYGGKRKLTEQEISEIWGNLTQTSNEEQDAIKFALAIQDKLFEINK